MSFQGLTIGIPKEIMTDERRVAATPEVEGLGGNRGGSWLFFYR